MDSRRTAVTVAALAILAAVSHAEEPSLIIESDGIRRLGVLAIEEGLVTCNTDYGPVRIPLSRVVEIVGPHSDQVDVTAEQRLEHRSPDPVELMNRVLRSKLGGHPEGLEVLSRDDRWEVWALPGQKGAKKEAKKLRKHLRGIINRMQAFFPKSVKPEEPCHVRIFEDSSAFLLWRDRGQGLNRLNVLAEGLRGFYLAEDSVILADLRTFGGDIAAQVDDFRRTCGQLFSGAGDVGSLLELEVVLTALSVACANGDRDRVKWALRALRQKDSRSDGAKPRPGEGSLPSADPAESGEATLVNYGYYSSATEELVMWRSDQLMSTLSHETFHYWMQHNCPNAPIWINEGFATYFETFSPRQHTKDQGFNPDRYAELGSTRANGAPFVPLADLLVLPTEAWQGQEGPMQSFLYALSYGFIHYLLHDDEFDFGNKGEKLLKGYLGSLADGATHEAARDEHFTGDYALDLLEPKFKYYLKRWKDPRR